MRNGERGTGNGEYLKAGIFKMSRNTVDLTFLELDY